MSSRSFAVALAAGLALTTLLVVQTIAQSPSPRTFILPDTDGYGVAECISQGEGSTCGRIVADSWCEAKGLGKALAFGRSDMQEVTGSTSAATDIRATSKPQGLLVITCTD